MSFNAYTLNKDGVNTRRIFFKLQETFMLSIYTHKVCIKGHIKWHLDVLMKLLSTATDIETQVLSETNIHHALTDFSSYLLLDSQAYGNK